uniref:Uncharacterized protein n=1 Tax=Fagus sylvatica TaxID=28930 RepID=A0A2N9GVN8_FAGSY
MSGSRSITETHGVTAAITLTDLPSQTHGLTVALSLSLFTAHGLPSFKSFF